MAGLTYVDSGSPGIRRRRRGRGFSYTAPDGSPVRDLATLERIRSLAIPPAWTDVWICQSARGHLQATGRDARGRNQYRYHPHWRATRDEAKFERMIPFGEALPLIHVRTDEHLQLRGVPREKVLALVVRLLESSLIRVGNEEYVRRNGSYGLTTLRSRHVDIDGSAIRFRFRGKGGRQHSVAVRDRRLAAVVRRLLDLPGQELFAYEDDEGELRTVRSDDVNGYLREIAGADFTAKDFRTWAATVLAAQALDAYDPFDTEGEAKQNVARAVELVASRLGNTPSICRKCYIHPAVIDTYLDGRPILATERREGHRPGNGRTGLAPEEVAVLNLLRQRSASGAV
jgi:DNA topoisomerase-1